MRLLNSFLPFPPPHTIIDTHQLAQHASYGMSSHTHHSILDKVRQHDDCSTLPITDDFPHVSDGVEDIGPSAMI